MGNGAGLRQLAGDPLLRALAVAAALANLILTSIGAVEAAPGDRSSDAHDRVRTDVIDENGTVTLRHGGKLHHIGIGRTHARTRVLVLAQDLHIRVINAATGELLRELTLDPARDYQPTGKPRGGRRNR